MESNVFKIYKVGCVVLCKEMSCTETTRSTGACVTQGSLGEMDWQRRTRMNTLHQVLILQPRWFI